MSTETMVAVYVFGALFIIIIWQLGNSNVRSGVKKHDPIGGNWYEAAKRDQKEAVYPGCERGYMHCLDQNCGCNERRPSPKFVRARAERLKREAIEEALKKVPSKDYGYTYSQATCMFEGGLNRFIYVGGERVAQKLSSDDEWSIEENLTEKAKEQVSLWCDIEDERLRLATDLSWANFKERRRKELEETSKKIEQTL